MQTFKQIIRTIILPVLVFIVLSTAVFEIFFHSELHAYQDIRERAAFAGSIDTLIDGASYSKRALIPEGMDPILGTSTYNLSASELTMQGRYQLLEEELIRNPVKTVYLELSLHTLSKEPRTETLEGDLYVIPRLDSPAKRLSYAFSAFSPKKYGWLYRQLLIRSMDDVKSFFMGEYTTVNRWQMRGYVPFDKGEEYRKIKRTPRAVYHTKLVDEIRYEENLEYLDRIASLCQNHHAELILVSMPMSEHSIAKYVNLQEIHDFYQEYAAQNDLTYIDFNLWKDKTVYLQDQDYQNATHLGNTQAPVFTEQFSRIMKDYFAGKDISGYFYPDFDALCRDRGYVNPANQDSDATLEKNEQ